MIVLQPIATAQSITILVRDHTQGVDEDYKIFLYDEQQNLITNITPTGESYSSEDGELTISLAHDFKQGRFYYLVIGLAEEENPFTADTTLVTADSDVYTADQTVTGTPSDTLNEVLHRNKIFVTDQTNLDKYTMLQGDYTMAEGSVTFKSLNND